MINSNHFPISREAIDRLVHPLPRDRKNDDLLGFQKRASQTLRFAYQNSSFDEPDLSVTCAAIRLFWPSDDMRHHQNANPSARDRFEAVALEAEDGHRPVVEDGGSELRSICHAVCRSAYIYIYRYNDIRCDWI